MKNISMLFCAGMLMGALCVVFVACNEPEAPKEPEQNKEKGAGTPVLVSEVSDGVAAFFNAYLPPVSGSSNSDFQFFEDRENRCLAINSVEELRALVPSSIELPSIDFDKHTLIIGQHGVHGSNFLLGDQYINNDPDKIELFLTIEVPETYPDMPCFISYWGVYPKLPQNPIIVSSTFALKNNPL